MEDGFYHTVSLFLWFPHKVHSLLCAFLYKQDRGDGTQLAPFSEGQFPGAGRWDCQTVCAAATPKETQVRQCTHMYKQHSISEILHLCQGCPHTYIYMHCVTLLGPLLIMHETVMYTHTHTHTHTYIYIYIYIHTHTTQYFRDPPFVSRLSTDVYCVRASSYHA